MTLPPAHPKAGERYNAYGYEWMWVEPQETERGHWLATDETRVKVFPADDAIYELRVTVPYGPTSDIEDMIVYLRPQDYDEAFHYSAEERKFRAN